MCKNTHVNKSSILIGYTYQPIPINPYLSTHTYQPFSYLDTLNLKPGLSLSFHRTRTLKYSACGSNYKMSGIICNTAQTTEPWTVSEITRPKTSIGNGVILWGLFWYIMRGSDVLFRNISFRVPLILSCGSQYGLRTYPLVLIGWEVVTWRCFQLDINRSSLRKL